MKLKSFLKLVAAVWLFGVLAHMVVQGNQTINEGVWLRSEGISMVSIAGVR